ncbi:hypothetical protein UlMin_025382 [Ulmus minor]
MSFPWFTYLNKIYDWFEERLEIQTIADDITSKYVPPHVNIFLFMMVLMMILHVFRVYLTGGFKKPRELTWVTGVVLAVLTVHFVVIGYSLPRDQIGYLAVKIVTGVPEVIPVIGSPLVELLCESASVRQSTLTRFYSLHTFALPLLTVVFMLMHFLIIRKQGISGPL